jgi:hypothetical protein
MDQFKKKTMYSGTAQNMKKKDPVLLGDTYGLAREMAGVSNKTLLSMKEAQKIENQMAGVLVKKNKKSQ